MGLPDQMGKLGTNLGYTPFVAFKLEPVQVAALNAQLAFFGLAKGPRADAIRRQGEIYDKDRNMTRRTTDWYDEVRKVLSGKIKMQERHRIVLRAVLHEALIRVYGSGSVDEEMLDVFISDPAALVLAAKGDKFVSPEFGPAMSAETEEVCLSRCYCRFSAVQISGTAERMEECLRFAQERLKSVPGNVLLRSVYLWNVFGRGSPDRVAAALGETRRYLNDSSKSASVIDEIDWANTIAELRAGRAADRVLLRSHIEDALCRSVLLDWLRTDGRASTLARRISNLPAFERWPSQLQQIFDWKGPGWRDRGVKVLLGWLEHSPRAEVARRLLGAFVGFRAEHEQLHYFVDRIYNWVKEGDCDPFTRWSLLWLAGMAEYRISDVIESTREWLSCPSARDDRLVLGTHLWLVGSFGSREQVADAVGDAAQWFQRPERSENSSLRVPLLIWLASRARDRNRIPPPVFERLMAECRAWANEHQGSLVTHAVELVDLGPSPQ